MALSRIMASTTGRKTPAYGAPLLEKRAIQFMLADSAAELWGPRLIIARGLDGL
jgi:hypothetical protein